MWLLGRNCLRIWMCGFWSAFIFFLRRVAEKVHVLAWQVHDDTQSDLLPPPAPPCSSSRGRCRTRPASVWSWHISDVSLSWYDLSPGLTRHQLVCPGPAPPHQWILISATETTWPPGETLTCLKVHHTHQQQQEKEEEGALQMTTTPPSMHLTEETRLRLRRTDGLSSKWRVTFDMGRRQVWRKYKARAAS